MPWRSALHTQLHPGLVDRLAGGPIVLPGRRSLRGLVGFCFAGSSVDFLPHPQWGEGEPVVLLCILPSPSGPDRTDSKPSLRKEFPIC